MLTLKKWLNDLTRTAKAQAQKPRAMKAQVPKTNQDYKISANPKLQDHCNKAELQTWKPKLPKTELWKLKSNKQRHAGLLTL